MSHFKAKMHQIRFLVCVVQQIANDTFTPWRYVHTRARTDRCGYGFALDICEGLSSRWPADRSSPDCQLTTTVMSPLNPPSEKFSSKKIMGPDFRKIIR